MMLLLGVVVSLESRSGSSQLRVVVLLSAGPGSIYMPAGHLFGLGQTHAVAQSSSDWLENQMSMLPLALDTTASP